jgi:hypothetical protein
MDDIEDDWKDDFSSWVTADIFPDPLWRGHYPGDLTELTEKTKEFLKHNDELNTGLERDGGVSSSSATEQPHSWIESLDFYNWLRRPTEEIWHAWSYKDVDQRQIARSWANFHPPRAWTDEHTHGPTDQVAVLYLDAPANSGNLQVLNPLFYHWEGTPRISGSNGWRDVPIQTGDVIVFPGWMMHRTGKNESDSDRLTINTNIKANPYQIEMQQVNLPPNLE